MTRDIPNWVEPTHPSARIAELQSENTALRETVRELREITQSFCTVVLAISDQPRHSNPFHFVVYQNQMKMARKLRDRARALLEPQETEDKP